MGQKVKRNPFRQEIVKNTINECTQCGSIIFI